MVSIWQWLFPSERHILHTSLSPEECRKRIDDKRVPHLWFLSRKSFSRRSLVGGAVSNRRFRLCRFRVKSCSPFPSIAYGDISALGNGTTITVRIGTDPVSRAFLALWVFGWLAFTVLPFSVGTSTVPPIVAFLLPLVGPAFALGLLLVGRFRARNEVAWLISLLKDTLEATEIEQSPWTDPPSTRQSKVG